MEQERRSAHQLVTVGVPLLVLALVVGTWLSWVSLPDLAAQLRWAKAAFVAAAHNQALPSQPATDAPTWQTASSWLVRDPAVVIGLTLLLRFQFSAAKAAQALDLGQRPSPGLGVGGWFIPVAQCWIPLRAWLHLTTPRSGIRSKIWLVWAAVLVGALASLTATGLSVVSLGWARGLFGFGLAAELSAVVALPSLTKDIGASHRQALGSAEPERRVLGSL